MTDLLFFYGTLMSGGHRAHALAEVARPVGPGRIAGLLFDVGMGGFPAYRPGEGVVVGEVWEPFGNSPAVRAAYLAAALRATDMIEGYYPGREHSSMYVRVEVPLLGDETSRRPARTVQTYRWNLDMRGLRPIASGDWRDWKARGEFRYSWADEGVAS